MITGYISIIAGFLMGCIPTGLILVRKSAGIDIRQTGTGNIGAMNSFEITNNKSTGFLVFLGDFLKGVIAVVIARLITHDSIFWVDATAFFVILGHNFNPFLAFKGGRGLASAVGCFAVINPLPILLWGLLWLAGMNMIKKQVHVGNIVATIFMPLLLYYTPEKAVLILNFFNQSKGNLIVISILICLLIMIKHIRPLIDLLKNEFKLITVQTDKNEAEQDKQ